MFIFYIFFQLFLVQADDSLPEFECTAIKIESSKFQEILGDKKFPSLSLRKYPSGKWKFNIKKNVITLDENQVSKTVGIDFKTFSYLINYKDWILKIDLVGFPPSRNGSLYRFKNSPQKSEELARLTCH